MRDDAKPLKPVKDAELFVAAALETAGFGKTASFLDTQAEKLCRSLTQATGIGIGTWKVLLWKHVGLPADSILASIISQTVLGWAPALAAGYPPYAQTDWQYSTIPQTALMKNHGPDPDGSRWNISALIAVGPNTGLKLRLSVPLRLAVSMVYKACGLRSQNKFSTPRPYDLHNMYLAVGLQQDQKGVHVLRKVFDCATLRSRNRALTKEYTGACLLTGTKDCFDCGASPGKCSLARRDKKAGTGECAICHKTKYYLNEKGVCTACVQLLMTTGSFQTGFRKSSTPSSN